MLLHKLDGFKRKCKRTLRFISRNTDTFVDYVTKNVMLRLDAHGLEIA